MFTRGFRALVRPAKVGAIQPCGYCTFQIVM